MTRETIYSKIQCAIEILLCKDKELFQQNLAERTITTKFACYLQEVFKDWDVDSEYNRDDEKIKALESGKKILPDIIIHKRKTKKNLLVIEIKKTTNTASDKDDLRKLSEIKSNFNYEHALFIRFKAGDSSDVGIERMEWVE